MKTAKIMFSIICMLFFSLFSAACAGSNIREIKKAVSAELEPLKKLDSDTAYAYLQQSGVLDSLVTDSDDSFLQELKDVLSMFFKQFDYKIQSVNVSEDGQSASVSVHLATLDSKSLSKDFSALSLRESIKAAAKSGSSESILSAKDRFLLLNHLLETGEYETVSSDCSILLSRSQDGWSVNRTQELENQLSGGLISSLADSHILTPGETLDIYLNTLLKMSEEDLSNYLGLSSLSSETDKSLKDIYQAMISQVHEHFDYEILGSTESAGSAEVEAMITTFDSDSIMEACQAEMETYLNTADALISGADARISHSRELLLKHIQENTAVKSSSTRFSMKNDGTGWKLTDPGNELGEALFGTIQIDEEA